MKPRLPPDLPDRRPFDHPATTAKFGRNVGLSSGSGGGRLV
ncbi:hypothetical protein ACWDKQ_18460 [Saccharopolyspora sp. NPDC000995]